jgi:hypothetical protein
LCLDTASLVNKLLCRNVIDADPTDDLSTEFERLHQHVNPSNLAALDKIFHFNLEALGAYI